MSTRCCRIRIVVVDDWSGFISHLEAEENVSGRVVDPKPPDGQHSSFKSALEIKLSSLLSSYGYSIGVCVRVDIIIPEDIYCR